MLTRREFLVLSGAACGAAHAAVAPPAAAPPALDFGAGGFIAAACERLIPETASSPGARAAGVPEALAVQLNGPWGAGLLAERHGAWHCARPIALPSGMASPRCFFATAIHALEQRWGRPGFAALPSVAQHHLLADLHTDPCDLNGVGSADFFDALLTLTVEAYFAHPHIAATRDRIEWPMRGFPGSHSLLSGQLG